MNAASDTRATNRWMALMFDDAGVALRSRVRPLRQAQSQVELGIIRKSEQDY